MKMQCVFPRQGQVTVGRDSGEEIGGWGGARGGVRGWGSESVGLVGGGGGGVRGWGGGGGVRVLGWWEELGVG